MEEGWYYILIGFNIMILATLIEYLIRFVETTINWNIPTVLLFMAGMIVAIIGAISISIEDKDAKGVEK